MAQSNYYVVPAEARTLVIQPDLGAVFDASVFYSGRSAAFALAAATATLLAAATGSAVGTAMASGVATPATGAVGSSAGIGGAFGATVFSLLATGTASGAASATGATSLGWLAAGTAAASAVASAASATGTTAAGASAASSEASAIAIATTGSVGTAAGSSTAAAVNGGDPLYADVALLLHGEGANGSTTFTDNSSAARTMTAAASAQISTAQFVSALGSASMDFTAGGDEARAYTPSAAGLAATGDCCIEFRLRMTSTAGGIYFLHGDGASVDVYVYTSSSGKLGFYVFGNSRTDIATISADTWYAICIDRSGSTVKVFVDGSQVDSSASSSSMGASATWYLGANPALSGANTGGRCYIDEFRLTMASRHQSAYTVDTTAFPNS